MDWSEFVSGLSEREVAVIECIIEGRSLRDAAKSFRVCDSTMQGDKRRLAVKILDFMGVDILIEVRRSPRWKDDIMTSRETLACKHERSHLNHTLVPSPAPVALLIEGCRGMVRRGDNEAVETQQP
jgi:hypothetical protein